MATRDIAIGEDIVEIPERLLMTASKVQHAGHLSEQQALTLWVYQQYSLGERSPWHAYISTLPQDFDSVPLFQLSGAFARKTGADRIVARSAAVCAGENCRPAPAAGGGLAVREIDWRRFVWAWLAVSTRSINLGRKHKDRLALAPFLDFLNHSETAQVTVRYDEHRRVFAIRSLVGYRKGQEVFISYGPHDNRHMLVEYGFVLEHNPFRFLELDSQVMDWISECKLVVQRRKQSAVKPEDFDRMVEVLKGYGLFGDYTFDNEPSFRLLAALHLLLPLVEEGAAVRRVLARWERWRRG
ncbi:SET domain-containing protein [Linderina pennispora]|uniref:SET domain-containing protein n=1 Tax=Linderina pennispora TaxID=61395 RepID=A0A1Y1W1F4_9FUNG|nr:SET domain-containing protein [Linderina pennispora]ORX67135.1 SET domain-containing protein [Linderina pennispora]